MYAIYANPEHLHFLVSRSPHISEDALATIIADSSEKFINTNKLALCDRFYWQNSASAFSVSKADVDRISKYILNQAEHHKKTCFDTEYNVFLRYYQKTLKTKK